MPPVVDGEVVDVLTSQGEFLARGYLNRRSQITVRLLTWQADEAVDEDFWARRLARAVSWRVMGDHEARRLVNAESDGLPGLIVDRYGEWLIVQALTLGVDGFKPIITRQLNALLKPRGIYERSDVDVREKEGLAQASGSLLGDEPPDRVEIEEGGQRYLVDVKRGHKTGFYLDQRENRQKIQAYVRNAEVLNLFAYTGGFAVAALRPERKSVVSVDSSADVLQLAQENVRLNGLPVNAERFCRGRCLFLLAQAARRETHLRRDHRRSAEVGADAGPDRKGRARLQRSQSGGDAVITPRRHAHHLLVLRPGDARSISEDRLRGGRGRRARCADRRTSLAIQ